MRIKIGRNRHIGDENPCFIIAEAGINHNGKISLAKKMIDTAARCGVDAVKFQTFKAEEFVSNPEENYTYYSQGKKVTESMLEMFKRCEFSPAKWKQIIDYCRKKGVLFLTTPQNPSDLDFILGLARLPLIKVGADDLTNLSLLSYYAKKGIPMIISAGMAYASEIEEAVATIRKTGNKDIVVLHCVSSYPAEAEEINLRKMNTIRDAFQVVVGFSDHSVGTAAATGAVAMGAKVVEKHFTLDKGLPGPDHWFSADPEELKELVNFIRYVERALGTSQLAPTKKEIQMRKLCRRSIVAAKPVKKGQKISRSDIAFKRPGTGLPPKYAEHITGKSAKRDLKKDELILFEDVC